MEDKGLNFFTLPLHNSVELLHQSIKRSTDPYSQLNFSRMSSNVAPGSKQQMASATSPTHDLVMAALTSCSLKFFLASEIALYHCSN